MTDPDSGRRDAGQDGQRDAGNDGDLTTGGMRALEAERTARREAEANARRLETRISELETAQLRRDVAAEKGLSAKQAERLRGATREELESDADELIDTFGPRDSGRGQPREVRPPAELRPGASPGDDGDDFDPSKVADQVRGQTGL